MQVKVKKLNANAVLPQYATAGAACFDLVCVNDVMITPGREHVALRTGLAFEIPEGYVMMVYSRSGHGFKNGIRLANGTGVIDSDYRGEVMVKMHNDGASAVHVTAGERIAQAMIVPVPQVQLILADELSDTARGSGGIGSTGTK
jgi:dUTP pyrophosphatase